MAQNIGEAEGDQGSDGGIEPIRNTLLERRRRLSPGDDRRIGAGESIELLQELRRRLLQV